MVVSVDSDPEEDFWSLSLLFELAVRLASRIASWRFLPAPAMTMIVDEVVVE